MKTIFTLIGVLIAERISSGSTIEIIIEIFAVLLALFLDLLQEVRRNERIHEMTKAEEQLQNLENLLKTDEDGKINPFEVIETDETEEDEK